MKYKINGNIIELECTDKTIVILSTEDEDILKEFNCFGITGSRSKYCFIERGIETKYGTVRQRIYLHRAIGIKLFGLEKLKHHSIDHKDRNRFNNTRENLRIASNHQNMANVVRNTKSNTGFKGVTEVKGRNLKKRFVLHFCHKNYGFFSTAEEAAKKYDLLSKEKYGDFAVLNFPD